MIDIDARTVVDEISLVLLAVTTNLPMQRCMQK
jgi:hypothetical protein